MKELAEYLKSERTKRGLTLRDISRSACISADMLGALEEGAFERIGTALLIRGFIRTYCEVLGIDPAPLLEQYSSDILAYDQQHAGIKRYRKWAKPIHGRKRLGFLGLLILCGSMMGALYGGIWVYNNKIRMAEFTRTTMVYPQQEFPPDLPKEASSRIDTVKKVEKKEQRPEAAVTPVTPVTPVSPEAGSSRPAVVAGAKESRELDAKVPAGRLPEPPSPVATAAERSNPAVVLAEDTPHDGSLGAPAKPSAHRFEAEAEQKTWIQVKIDDDKTYNVMMLPGDKRVWETKQGMNIVVGNAGGVRMKWDGAPVGTDGKPGQVVRFRLPDSRLAEKPKPR